MPVSRSEPPSACTPEEGGLRPTFSAKEDGEFRTEPLLPGHYSLHAQAQTRKGFRGREVYRWSGDVEGINVVADEETADITIQVAPEERE